MKRNYPLRKLDKKECRKTGIPPLHIPLSQKLLSSSAAGLSGSAEGTFCFCISILSRDSCFCPHPRTGSCSRAGRITLLWIFLLLRKDVSGAHPCFIWMTDYLIRKNMRFSLLQTGNGFFLSAGIFRNLIQSSVWTVSSSKSGK